ncbi:MAG TPA: hypothetical protein VFZ67_09465 [Nitrososphaera sp.]
MMVVVVITIIWKGGDLFFPETLSVRVYEQSGPTIPPEAQETRARRQPIVPAVGGTNANTPADNPAYPVVLVKR